MVKKPVLSPLMKILLAGCANGKTLKELAEESYVSYSNATNTIDKAKDRLDAATLTQAVVKAMSRGYISHPTGADLSVFPIHDA